MRLVRINPAEAIVEPFWDGGSSEHPDNKYSLLSHYKTCFPGDVQGRVKQSWCSLEINIDSASAGKTAFTMACDCDLDISQYDIFRYFGSVPSWAAISLTLTTDTGSQMPFRSMPGHDNTDEYDGPISGSRISHLKLEIVLAVNKPAVIAFFWFGLANQARQLEYEARQSPYDSHWQGCLITSESTDESRFQPRLNLLIDQDDLKQIREGLAAGSNAGIYAQIRQEAIEDLALEPEKQIGTFIGKPDRRWCRTRDMKLVNTAGKMERLALVGLIERNEQCLRMAARMALSAAHTEYWCESIMGVFPGATWHHRSFTEHIYCAACALVLDWAGHILSPYGRQIIEDAIIMKGLPRIESDFKRMAYIRSMNQGIAFTTGRVLGLLAVQKSFPRYASLIDEAEKDLNEMVDAYVRADGGTLEGPSYWHYTFVECLTIYQALARYRQIDLKDIVPPSLIKTGQYALAMLSIAGDGTGYLPINDAHPGQCYRLNLVAAYARMTQDPAWKQLFRKLANRDKMNADIFSLLNPLPNETDVPDPDTACEAWRVLPVTGHLSSIRRGGVEGLIHFHFCSGPSDGGHYHEDKGSFILEVAGEALAIDRGITSYDHPETMTLKNAMWHNLLLPVQPGKAIEHQPGSAPGGALVFCEPACDGFMLTSDNREAWSAGLFEINRRRVFSPCPEIYIIDDQILSRQDMQMRFIINTYGELEQRGGEFWIIGRKGCLRILPLNWSPDSVQMKTDGIDGDCRDVRLLGLQTGTACGHRLLTAIEVVPRESAQPQYRHEHSLLVGIDEKESVFTWQIKHGDSGIAIMNGQLAADGRLICQAADRERHWLTCCATDNRWAIIADGKGDE